MTPRKLRKETTQTTTSWRSISPENKLLVATDHGYPVTVPLGSFAPILRDGGWGPHAETFLRFNSKALQAINVQPVLTGNASGIVIQLKPGDMAGAVPLKSGLTGQVVGGLVVKPRFGWSGVGQILSSTGWHAAPEFVDLSLVPGSAREVPVWVLAGPVLALLEMLLRTITPGYRLLEEVLTKPRGQIIWSNYLTGSLIKGTWHRLPCRFPDLTSDPLLLRQIKWALERIHRDLINVGGSDPIALGLAALAIQLIEALSDITALVPRREELDKRIMGNRLISETLRQGIEALAWIVDERGLGGGSERDGLSWVLPLERLWESYVESVYREEAANIGGEVRVGRLRETVFPLNWTDPTHRTLGHLVPDIVIKRGRSIQVIDAKYKAHLSELEESQWYRFEQEVRDAHRADIHQVLAYASLYDSEDITATLVYPLRVATYKALKERGRDRSFAELMHGGRLIQLELRGIPFGASYLVNN